MTLTPRNGNDHIGGYQAGEDGIADHATAGENEIGGNSAGKCPHGP